MTDRHNHLFNYESLMPIIKLKLFAVFFYMLETSIDRCKGDSRRRNTSEGGISARERRTHEYEIVSIDAIIT